MKDGLYLLFGFALFFILNQRKQRGRKKKSGGKFYPRLLISLVILAAIDSLLNAFLWGPVGRGDLRLASLFFWALAIDRARGEFFPALVGFSLWIIGEEGTLPPEKRWVLILALPLGVGVVEWLLEGLRDRLRIADVPRKIKGLPLLFWLASILALLFQGIWSAARPFVNWEGWVKL